MRTVIPLTDHRETALPIRFFLSASTCQNAKLSIADINRIGKSLSASPSLYINRYQLTKGDTTEYRYDIFFQCGVFTCGKNPEYGNYSATFFAANDFDKKRKAIRSGIAFSFQRILLSVKYGTETLYFEDGKQVDYPSTGSCNGTMKYIDDQFDAQKPEDDATVQINDEMDSLLKRAEAYSETDSILEETAALLDGKLFYEKVTASENTVGDSQNYRFFCRLSQQQQAKQTKRQLLKKWTANRTVQLTLTDESAITMPIFQADFSGNAPFVELTFTQQTDFHLIPPYGFLQLPLNSTVKHTQQKAFREIREGKVPAEFLADVLGNRICKPLKQENMETLLQNLENRDYPLNEFQRKAVIQALSAQDLFLVMGPPGTGKTTVIAEWVKYLVSEKKARVLISSQNNSAVDNVLKKLKNEPDVEMLRISGSLDRVDDEVSDAFYSNKIQKTRQIIADAVADNQQGLAQLKEKWKAVEPAFDALAPVYETYRQAKQTLAENINTAAVLYKKARAMRPDIAKKAEQFRKKCRTLSLVQKLYDAYSRFALIRTVFFFIGAILRWVLITGAKNAESVRISLQADTDAYNRNIDIYNKLIQEARTVLFERITTASTTFQAQIHELDLQSIINDPYDIFPISSEQLDHMEDIKQFHQIFDILSSGREKLNALPGILDHWSEHITNTQNYAVESILLQGANVVGATCVGISSNPYAANLDFDVVIIDEAGQIQIHNCLIPMRLGKKVIMLGDHKQLPPVAKQEALQVLEGLEIDWSLYTQSLFEYLYDRLPEQNKIMLKTQFRMPKIVADILSKQFYQGEYESHPSKQQISSGIRLLDNKPLVVIDTSDSTRRHEGKDTHHNEYEAEICQKLFTKLFKEGHGDHVAIVAGLNDQVELIQTKISAVHGQSVAKRAVHTVDSYQGRECDTVIFSFTRSSTRQEEDVRIGFLSELRRLNVAMSRCKRCLVLIGDMKFLTQCQNTTGFDGMAEKGLTGTEAQFSEFLTELLAAADNPEALRLFSKQFYERLGDES